MAKNRTSRPDDTDPQVEGAATSGGDAPVPAAGQATVEGNKPQGTAVYPPGPSDQAGEKTDNVPPAKKLPPDPPPADQVDAHVALEAQLNAMAGALRNLGIDPEPICDAALGRVKGDGPTGAAGPTRTAVVSQPGSPPVEVQIPADAKDPSGAAIEAYKQRCGLWHLPQQPNVELK